MAADTVVTPVPETDPKVVNVVQQFADDPNNPTDATKALIDGLPAAIKESKAGYKTTEFWVSLVASALVVLEVIPADADIEGVLVSVIAAIYALSRGIAKKGIPAVEVEVKKDEA